MCALALVELVPNKNKYWTFMQKLRKYLFGPDDKVTILCHISKSWSSYFVAFGSNTSLLLVERSLLPIVALCTILPSQPRQLGLHSKSSTSPFNSNESQFQKEHHLARKLNQCQHSYQTFRLLPFLFKIHRYGGKGRYMLQLYMWYMWQICSPLKHICMALTLCVVESSRVIFQSDQVHSPLAGV